jgi:hypothetical protein
MKVAADAGGGEGEGDDADGDGYTASQGDCNDNDASVNPGVNADFLGSDGLPGSDGVEDGEYRGNLIDDDCNPATSDISDTDQALIDFINNSDNTSGAVVNELKNVSPLSDAVLIAMIHRVPSLSSNENLYILSLDAIIKGTYRTNLPSTDNVLIEVMNNSGILDPDDHYVLLDRNYPVSEPVLDKMVKTESLMSSSQYANILIANSDPDPLPSSILDQCCAGTTPMNSDDEGTVLTTNSYTCP